MGDIKTGIKGFDKLIGGGFSKGKNILLSGTPGTGKTIFALEFLYHGAELGDKGLYISFEESKSNLISQAAQFGWDLNKLEKDEKVKIISIPVKDINEKTAKEILKLAKRYNAKRLVVDSLSALSINSPTTFSSTTDVTDYSIKRFMYSFITEFRNLDLVSLFISQTTEGQLSRDGVSEFICDGILHIRYDSIGGEFSRSMTIRKMRECKNDEDMHPVEISKKGLVIHTLK